jgi:DNA primase small subunit
MQGLVLRANPTAFSDDRCHSQRIRRAFGPVTCNPSNVNLSFDIDMTDYDSIRTCCSGKGICRRCWGFIAAAVMVLDKTLREDFGFNHILWVYSGRRGIHCWVSDREAMDLTDDQRRSIMGYLEVLKEGKSKRRRSTFVGTRKTRIRPKLCIRAWRTR